METCLIMARNNNTSATDWLKMPLVQLIEWVKINNSIQKEEEKRRKRAGK